MNTIAQSLADRIENRSAVVGVIGLGYVGLPLISAFTRAGFRCLGFDVDANKVQQLQSGHSYIKHIASETIADWLQSGLFAATADQNRLGEADILLICVPTPLNESRDPI